MKCTHFTEYVGLSHRFKFTQESIRIKIIKGTVNARRPKDIRNERVLLEFPGMRKSQNRIPIPSIRARVKYQRITSDFVELVIKGNCLVK